MKAEQMVIGPESREWDMTLLVEYPSRQKFLAMALDLDYMQVHEHRGAALSDSRLIACRTIAALSSPEPGRSERS